MARQLNERPRETLQFETQQKDLTPVLRRPVEPAGVERTLSEYIATSQFDPKRSSAGGVGSCREEECRYSNLSLGQGMAPPG